MKSRSSHAVSPLAAVLLATLLLGACKSNEPKPEAETAPTAQAAPAPTPAAEPAAPAKPVCPPETAKSKTSKTTSTKTSKTKTAEPDCVPAKTASKTSATPAPAPAPAPAPVQNSSGSYNLSKNKPVTDSSKVESGQGTTVKGINDWEGEITGLPGPGSKFTRLKIGMPIKQVTDLVGEPTDQGVYVTAKAFVPFYFGSDKTRQELVYKGQGRLIFSHQAGFGSGQYLTWIIHNPNEPGYR